MHGYSGTPLAKKLGITTGSRVFVHGAPGPYLALLDPPPGEIILQPGVDTETDVAHLFTTSRTELESLLRENLTRIRPNAAIWVSWPKKASRVPTDITEDTIRGVALPLGLVDVKVCAVDEVWSGLKLVLRKENRPGQP